jgi:type II secretory pathway component GspD/PulD (secretin)
MKTRCIAMALCCALAASFQANAQLEIPLVDLVEPLETKGSDLITLNMEYVDVTLLLRLLSESQRVSIIASPEVSQEISINLYDATFEDALNAIVGAAGYTYNEVDGIIYVVDPDNTISGHPNVVDATVRTFRINYADRDELVETLQDFISDTGVAVAAPNKTIAVTDTNHRVSLVAELIKSLDTPRQQVLISTHIINVNRSDNLNIGVGFDTLPFSLYGIEAIGAGFAQYFADEALERTGLFAGTIQSDSRILLEALDERENVEILAAPQIIALDGEIAHLQVGERLGFRVTTTTETSSLQSIEFLEVGTVLDVTPHIADNGLIRMEISPKVSNGVVSVLGLPSESTTEVTTQMIVNDGSTIVIGGLLNATKGRIRSQIPFLGDLPVIGWLFGRNQWIDNKDELIVLITPHIVGPNPTPYMQNKIEAARQEFDGFAQQGILNIDPHAPNEDKPKETKGGRWRQILKGQ